MDATQTLNACSGPKPLSAFTGSCVVYIKFAPAVLNANSDTATIHTSGGSPTVTLSGKRKSASATASPNPLSFTGIQLVNTSSAPLAVTLTNGTASNITISGTPTIAGANAADFAVASGSTCSGTVASGGATCIVNITFTPKAVGARTATLTIADSVDVNSPHTVTLNATGAQPGASLGSATMAFGTIPVNGSSGQQTVTLTNNGTATLHISSVVLGGTNSGDFTLVAPASGSDCRTVGTVAASSTCVVAATFTPTALNARTATITIADDAAPATQTINLTGSGGAPSVSFNPTTIAFGNQRQSVPSGQMTSTLMNAGTTSLTITNVALGGTNAGDFTLVAPATGTDCRTVGTISASGTCVLAATFTPGALGARAATVTFTDNSSPTTQVLNLTGTGTFPQSTPSPSPFPFGNERLNTARATQTVTLANSGTDTLHITTVAPGGTNDNQFSMIITGTICTNGSTVAAAANCVVKLTFTPTALGAQAATVPFTDDASPTAQVVNLTGAGTFPQASPAPTTVPFGSQRLNTTSTSQTVTLTNGGTDPLHITTVALGGTNANQFVIVALGTTCTNGATVAAAATVAPAATCAIKLTFTPAAAGARGTAILTITDDATPATQTVSLSGAGISFRISVPTPPTPETAATPITATIQLTPGTGGFPNPVTFAATNLPPDTTASFSQTSLTPGSATVTTTLTLTTTIRSGGNATSTNKPSSHRPISGGWLVTALLALLAMVTLRRGYRMQRFAYWPLAVLLLSAAIITGCTKAATGTPAGSYNVTVTAMSGSYSQSTPVAIVVK